MSLRKACLVLAVSAPITLASIVWAKSSLEIKSRDKCDPSTFNAGRTSPLCTGSRTGNVTLQQFNAALTSGGHNAWKFDPGTSGSSIDKGGTVRFTSDGGETHTFTRVENFGGGIVPPLNAAVGNAATTPECAAMGAGGLHPTSQGVIVAAGDDSQTAQAGGTLLPPGEHHFQCCLHPWMRTTITVR